MVVCRAGSERISLGLEGEEGSLYSPVVAAHWGWSSWRLVRGCAAYLSAARGCHTWSWRSWRRCSRSAATASPSDCAAVRFVRVSASARSQERGGVRYKLRLLKTKELVQMNLCKLNEIIQIHLFNWKEINFLEINLVKRINYWFK